MSDFDRLQEIFKTFDLPFEILDQEYLFIHLSDILGENKITASPNLACRFAFDGYGKFIQMSIFED